MRLFLMLVVLLMVQYKTFGQELLYWNNLDDAASYEALNFHTLWPFSNSPNDGERRSINGTKALGVDVNANQLQAYVEFSISELECDSMYATIKAKGNHYDNLTFQYLIDSTWTELSFYTEENIVSYNPYYHVVSLSTNNFDCASNQFRVVSITTNIQSNGSIDDFCIYGVNNCQYDSNQDGMINAPDLIDFLSWYGTTAVCD